MGVLLVDITHLTINIVMAVSIIGGALVMGVRLGELQSMIKEIREQLVDVKAIPVIKTQVGQLDSVVSKMWSEHRQLERKVAKMQGENTGRFHIPPENGDDR
jgi:hypothetical protein